MFLFFQRSKQVASTQRALWSDLSSLAGCDGSWSTAVNVVSRQRISGCCVLFCRCASGFTMRSHILRNGDNHQLKSNKSDDRAIKGERLCYLTPCCYLRWRNAARRYKSFSNESRNRFLQRASDWSPPRWETACRFPQLQHRQPVSAFFLPFFQDDGAKKTKSLQITRLNSCFISNSHTSPTDRFWTQTSEILLNQIAKRQKDHWDTETESLQLLEFQQI